MLRPGVPPATGGTAYGCMDQPAARVGGERRGATLIYAGRCLKVVDKFRHAGQQNGSTCLSASGGASPVLLCYKYQADEDNCDY